MFFFFYNLIGDIMKIYIDLVLLLNFLIDLILIFSVALILRRQTNLKKIIKGALLGSISTLSLIININSYLLIILKIITAFLMVVVVFGFKDIKYSLKNMFYLYTSSIVLGGFLYMLELELCYQNKSMLFYHNSLALNFTVLLVLSPIILYFYVKQAKELKDNYSKYYNIDIYLKDGSIKPLTAFLDTGNKLVDPYFKRPIILVNKSKINFNYLDTNILIVPYDTLNNHGLLKCIVPDKVYIDKIGIKKNFLIGISEEEIKIDGVDCILSSKLLEEDII